MAYIKTNWVERIREFANRFTLSATGNPNEFDITRVEGTITEQGVPLSIANLNNMEDGIEQAHIDIENHIQDKNNPHDTLVNVDNFATANQIEAQEGTANDKFMTPLRTKEAINSLGGLIKAEDDLVYKAIRAPVVDELETLVAESDSFGTTEVRGIATFNNHDYVYVGGGLSAGRSIKKLRKNDMFEIDSSADLGANINDLISDETDGYLYAVAGQIVFKVNHSDMSVVAQSSAFGSTINSIRTDGSHLYTGQGGSTSPVRKVDKTTLAELVLSVNIWSGADSVGLDDGDFVYAGTHGNSGVTTKLDKATLQNQGQTANHGSRITGIAVHEDYVYSISSSSSRLKKYNVADMSLDIQSPANTVGNVLYIVDGFLYNGRINKFSLETLVELQSTDEIYSPAHDLAWDEHFFYNCGNSPQTARKYNRKIYYPILGIERVE